jgi:hypothetical protein
MSVMTDSSSRSIPPVTGTPSHAEANTEAALHIDLTLRLIEDDHGLACGP